MFPLPDILMHSAAVPRLGNKSEKHPELETTAERNSHREKAQHAIKKLNPLKAGDGQGFSDAL